MDKYEYKIKADEIKELIAQGDYVQAAEIADSIDWRRVKSVMMLCTISDLYKINRRYEDAKDLLLLAYERRPGGRTICYSLCELSIKTEEFVQAVEYYKEFVSVAPKDPGRYILQYKIFEAQNVSLEERIEVLEELKKRDYREKWAYELAYLYHRVGLATRCVEECDELVLWFGEGKYVTKALELKQLHQPLTPAQQEIYDYRLHEAQHAAMPTGASDEEFSYEMDVPNGDTQIYGAVSLPEEASEDAIYSEEDYNENWDGEPELDIHVKTMDMGRYNTLNLQEELAAGLKEVLEDNGDPIMQSIMKPLLDADTESLDMPEIDEVDENDLEPETAQEDIVRSEVFFGETIEMSEVQAALKAEQQMAGANMTQGISKPAAVEELPQNAKTEEKVDVTAQTVMQQMQWETMAESTKQVMTAQPPREMAEVLAQESDGQLSLVMPEKPNVEKQITGQLRIEDILSEWERLKKENEEKGREEVRKHVLAQTGDMFTEFEASVRDGLLEKLEKDEGIERDADIDIDEEILKMEEDIISQESAEQEAFEEIEEDEGQEIYEEFEKEQETFEELETEEEPEADEEPEAFAEPETEEGLAAQESEEPEAYEEPEAFAEPETQEGLAVQESQGTGTYEEPEIYEEFQAQEESAAQESDEPTTYEEPAGDEPGAYEEPETEESLAAQDDMGQEVHEDSVNGFPVNEESVKEDPIKEEPEREPVEREKAKLRSLTEEEKEMFAPYIHGKRAKEQLINVLDNISMAAYTGNVIITGGEGTDTMSLAKNIVRELKQTDSNFSGRMAKISGKALNGKNVPELITQLASGALIVHHAFDMTPATATELYQSLQQEQHGIVILLEDTRHNMEKLLERNGELQNSFTNRMDVEALSNDALVSYGKQYAREKEFSIDAVGVLSLHTRIEALQTMNHAATVVDVQDIVDEAIRHSKRKNIGHFFDVLLGKRYDDEDMIILGEKDFSKKEG